MVASDVVEGSLALYGQEDIAWTRWLRSVVGLRADYFGFNVEDHLEDLSSLGTKTSGVRQAVRVSPKASLVLTPVRPLDIYLNFGMGYHSNDARGVVRSVDAVTPLTRAIGYELGARTRLFDRLDLAGAFNTAWREAQFANVSRLPGETGPASCPAGTRPVQDGAAFRGCEDVHFTPGAPINLQAMATLFF